MPKVSIVSIAKNESEFSMLKEKLKKQTFKDWEFVYSTKKGIPQAWNEAIKKAKGKIIIITESDALPLSRNWIKDMVKAVKKNGSKTIIKGIEVIPTAWNFSNLACYSKVLKQNRLDESYPIAEDTELFTRLYKKGYIGKELPIAPVVHRKRFKGFWREVKNGYLYGKLLTKIRKKYLAISFGQKIHENIVERELSIIFSRIAFLIGILRSMIL